ncbi:Low-density lipoprotein receptor-related protein 4 [Orchesella cincta]|uniref:Low-density lipoprotein receptor-related protein 4 n=1 Tax=Orchesella cincta TaxID=48709 RepID=A0A1D2MB83_ORCCI|nr:Low-density lipoprotein receptor-related protein 4 [Orchesella cincta]
MISRSSTGRERMYPITKNDEGRPVDVAYDARNNLVYWTDASPHAETIYRATLDGKNTSIVADSGLLLPEGIAFDWITGNIYFADSNLSHIAVCRNDSTFCSVLIQETIDKPRGIALHPNQGIMFWTDWGNSPAIMRAGMDGSSPVAIVFTNLKWPNGITVDQGNSRIYWADANLDPNQPIQRTNPCENARCSHICTISPIKSFSCFCPVGMILDKTIKSCVEPDDLVKLVIAFKSTIKTMRFNSIGTEVFDSIVLPKIKSVSAVVYNPINNTVILSDTGAKKIYEYSFKTKRLSVLIDQHLDSVKGMDIDPVGENLYWIDAGKQTVEVMSFRTRARAIIMHGVDSLLDILVVPQIRSLFIAGMDKSGGKIYKVQMNGNSSSVILNLSDKEAFALTYDSDSGNILWADKVNRSIETLSPDGQSNYVTVNQAGAPFDIVKYGNQIFWTDMFTQEVKFYTFDGSNYVRP